jgi:hypothetical protein
LGVDFRKFISEGLPLDEAASLNDVMVNRAMEFAKKRIKNDG